MKLSSLILGLALSTGSALYSQSLNTAAGYIPGQPYATNNVDTIGYANGAVSVHIPIRSFKQQDPVSIDYSIEYGSKHLAMGWSNPDGRGGAPVWAWTDSSVFDTGMKLSPAEGQHWTGARLSMNHDYRLTSVSDDNYDNGETVLVTPDGGHHKLGVDGYATRTLDATDGYSGGGDRQGVTNAWWNENEVSSPQNAPIPLIENRGFPPITLHFDPNNGKPNAIWDAKGLILPWADINTGEVGVVDSAAPCPASPPDSAAAVAFRIDMPAPPQTTSPYWLCYSNYNIKSNFPSAAPAQLTLPMLTAVVLPNRQAWQFAYSDRDPSDDPSVNYGTLTKLTFPSGAYITYQYATVQPCPRIEADGTNVSRFVTRRAEYSAPGGTPAVWTYAFVPGTATLHNVQDSDAPYYDYTDATMMVVRPDLTSEIHDLEVDDNTCAGHENSVVVNDPQGNFMMETDKRYVITGWWMKDNTGRVWTDDQTFTQQWEETDFADGSWTSETNEIKIWQPGKGGVASFGNPSRSCKNGGFTCQGLATTWTDTDYAMDSDPNVANAGLVDLVQKQTTYDNAGNILRSTKYIYDGGQYIAPYGSLIEMDKWVNKPGPGSWLAQTFVHDIHGTATSMTDALNHTTSYGYDPFEVYLQSTILPTTNGVNHSSSVVYDPNSDLPISSTDQRGSTTTYTYDALLRPIGVVLPAIAGGNGGATVTYDDANLMVTASMVQSLTPPVSVVASATFDGFGRTLSTKTTDSQGTIETDTKYDIMGRVQSVSNPYRSASDSTFGLTCTDYDYYGRTVGTRKVAGSSCSATSPSLLSSKVKYSAYTTDTFDGVGHHSQQHYDGLGRLTTVFEPDASNNPTLETDYGYDGLGNLISVHQVGQAGVDAPLNRRFDYDSLSRLLASYGPETGASSTTCPGAQTPWSLCYVYDPAGNLKTKTDARGISTNRGYDELGRLLSQSYSGLNGAADPSNTPSQCYLYDLSQTQANFTGLLSKEWTQLGQCSLSQAMQYGGLPAGSLTGRIFDGYDALGHVTADHRCILTTCKYNISITYDLAGNLTAFGNIQRLFDSANRLVSVSPQGASSVVTPFYKVTSFGPAGPTTINIGNNLTKSRSYDAALRVVGETTVVK